MSLIDWRKCIICQEDTPKEALKCPLNGHGSPEINKESYRAFIENVESFREANASPVDLQFGNDITIECLCLNKASWHKSCRLKFSASKLKKTLERIDLKRSIEVEAEKQPIPKCRKRQSVPVEETQCVFCNGAEKFNRLHSFETLETDRSVRQMAHELKDFSLLGRISEGDLVAIEAKYHLDCLISLRNRSLCSQKKRDSTTGDNEKMDESRAFVELVEYIDRYVDNGTKLFKLAELHSLYVTRLADLGIDKMVNKTRLKSALLAHYPKEAVQEQTDGKNTVLIFRDAMAALLKEALKKRDFSEDVKILAKAATIIRKDMFANKGFSFSGSFPLDCQKESIPSSLTSLVSMIVNGVNIQDQGKAECQACLTVCETIVFNTKKRTCETKTGLTRHSLARAPPLPLYVGLKIHSLTRSKTLVEKMYQMGISVSYDRIMEIEDWLATSLSERFKEDGCVSPASLRSGIFSVGALDNLDHNPSSTTSVSSFHGTGISIFQFPTESKPGEGRPPLVVPPSGTEHVGLPASYASVSPVALTTSSVSVPEYKATPVQGDVSVEDAIQRESHWVTHALTKLDNETISAADHVAWAAYHSNNQHQPNDTEDLPAITALLPLFYEKAATPAMIKHGMDVIREATSFLNPGQIPVVALDQPLFALAKSVQWKWPDKYGEDKYVIMFGGLHLEMALWSTVGDLLEGSGWTNILTDADVASSGVADGFLKASHLTRTR